MVDEWLCNFLSSKAIESVDSFTTTVLPHECGVASSAAPGTGDIMYALNTLSLVGSMVDKVGLERPKNGTVLILLATPKSEPNLRSAFIFPPDRVNTIGKRPADPSDQVVSIPENT